MKHKLEIREADFPGDHWVIPDDDDERSIAEHSEVDAARTAIDVAESWLDDLLPVAVTRRIPSSAGERYVMVERFDTILNAEEFIATLTDAEAGDYSIDARTG